MFFIVEGSVVFCFDVLIDWRRVDIFKFGNKYCFDLVVNKLKVNLRKLIFDIFLIRVICFNRMDLKLRIKNFNFGKLYVWNIEGFNYTYILNVSRVFFIYLFIILCKIVWETVF